MVSALVHRMPASLLLSLPLLTIAACGPKVTNDNIEALNRQFEAAERNGRSVTLKEVESIMGPPHHVENFPIEMRTVKELPGARYYYEQDGQTVELHFIDNRLIRRVLRFGEDPPEEKDRPGYKTPLRPLPDPDAADAQTPAPAQPEPELPKAEAAAREPAAGSEPPANPAQPAPMLPDEPANPPLPANPSPR
ncbi:MAG TPA: hypothetical protein VF593_01280 [Chthoniobacteraceae bacterium]|jgi:hypothetical protein